jgi:uroporphyrinogen-III synthase
VSPEDVASVGREGVSAVLLSSPSTARAYFQRSWDSKT